MSARHHPERIVTPPSRVADWSGTLTPVGVVDKTRPYSMIGQLICSATGWRLALTAAFDDDAIYLSGTFDGPVMADDAAPWAAEHEMAKPHQARATGYDAFWTGSMPRTSKITWAGTLGDRYGGRLAIQGKAQAGHCVSLRAAVAL